MVVYSFFIFDRHCECIYIRQWLNTASSAAQPLSRPVTASSAATVATSVAEKPTSGSRLSIAEQAKLVFGVIFSLRNMVKKLCGPEDSFLCYRTGHYKLHYYETLSSLRFVMLTDIRTESLKSSLHQIYVNLYVEYGKADIRAQHAKHVQLKFTKMSVVVVKNPLSPVEHAGGEGVNNELFELGIDSFVRTID
ncbi:TRAPP subunit bet5 [Arthrobotrys conoides]|uniref:Trafficking protein particle complex subunit n=1 Tax=Arthrobotrys conoides TaxID=74498 RepID=A0AAN8RYY0_9PEZI